MARCRTAPAGVVPALRAYLFFGDTWCHLFSLFPVPCSLSPSCPPSIFSWHAAHAVPNSIG